MAKPSASHRNRRPSGLRVEALEARQLLAAVTGSGTEVGSNIQHPNGNVYDQVLMTGASVTVSADAGQVTRVSFLDAQGDIVQAEFGGKGTLTINLDNFKSAAPAANYNQPGVNYVGGLATFTINGSDATTNFSVFSVGSANAVNQSLFAGGKTGGNNFADIARILINQDPVTGTGSFGGIRAGNAVFSDTQNLTGISAANVSVRDVVTIGDIDAKDSAIPYLLFGDNSTFGTLTLSGGDLVQTNSLAIFGSGFASITSVEGTTSAGKALPGQAPSPAALALLDSNPSLDGRQPVVTLTLDASTSFNLTNMTQADITNAFSGRAFTNDVTISGDLAAGLTLSAAEFRGSVTFTGKVAGAVTVDSNVKNLVLNQGLGAAFKAATIGDISAGGSVSGAITAKSIGNVSVNGSLSSTISTDYDGNGIYTAGEKTVGNVTITGNDSGRIVGVLGIGNISIGGDVTGGTATGSFNATANDKFVTLSSTSATTGESAQAAIGTISIGGDVNLRFSNADAGIANLVNLNRGTYGNITVSGAGALNSTDLTVPNFLGGVRVNTLLTAKSGTLSVTDNASLVLGEIRVAGANSTLGDVSVKSTGGAGSTIATTTSTQSSATFATSAITLAGAEKITINALTAATIGSLSATTTDTASSQVTLKANVIGTSSIGNVNLDAGTKGAISWTADLGASNATAAATRVGAVTVKAATTTFDSSKGIIALGGLTSFTASGDVTFGSIGTTASFELGGTSGALTFNGTTTFGSSKANVATIQADNNASSLDTIGSINFNGRVIGGVNTEIRASAIGDITIKGSLATNQALVSDLNIQAANNGDADSAAAAETVARDGSNLSSYAIGNVTVQSTDITGIPGAFLFSGANTFFALGKIGNINLTGGGSSVLRASLFGNPSPASGAGVAFVVGDGDGLVDSSAGIDFDGDATIGTVTNNSAITAAQETGASFSTDANVSIGNVTIVAAGGSDRIIGAGGASQTAADGLLVLAGVKATSGTNLTANALSRIDTNLVGTIGKVEVSDLNVLLSVSAGNFTTTTVTPPRAGIIAAAGHASLTGAGTSNIGTVNSTNVTFGTAGTSRVLGSDATDVTLTDATVNEIVVIRI